MLRLGPYKQHFCITNVSLSSTNYSWRTQDETRKKRISPSCLLPVCFLFTSCVLSVTVTILLAMLLCPRSGRFFLSRQLNSVHHFPTICRTSLTVDPSETPLQATQLPRQMPEAHPTEPLLQISRF